MSGRARFFARAAWRAVAFTLSAAFGAWLVLRLSVSALPLVTQPRNATSLDLLPRVEQVRKTFRRAGRAERILLVGDSVLNTGTPSPVPNAVQRGLLRSGHSPFVLSTVWWPGWSPTSEYSMGDDLLALNPDRIVFEVNPKALGANALSTFGYPELSGHLALRRYPEAFSLALSQAGITLNRALFYRALLAAGLEPVLALALDVQAKLFLARDTLEAAVERATDVYTLPLRKTEGALNLLATTLVPGRFRANRSSTLVAFDAVFGGVDERYPPLVTLGVLVRRFAAAGKRPLVWVAPTNVDHYRTLDLDLRGLPRTIAAMRTVVERNGGTFVDLHEILRDAQFGDSGDHPSCEGPASGAAVLGASIASAIHASEGR
ncbi:MAG TPA: hypothetical protein VHE30_21575 [Polyangiaceae bacterium]|nr:hypothetical protein [Polyangiaceae bacterium]